MRTRLILARRIAALGALAVLSLAATVPARAQNSQTDGRWQAWLGCWTPANALVRVIGRAATSLVCILPSSKPTAVDVVTLTDGHIVDRAHVDTDGRPFSISKDGCTGWQSAKWSPSARRVYMKSEFTCSGAPATHVSAVYALAGAGQWIDVQGMRVEKSSGVHAVRYREASSTGPLPDEIAQRLQQHAMARTAAMLAASAPPSLVDVEEASHELDPAVVSTWLIETAKLAIERPAPLTGKQLLQLANHGVPGSVIDVMVGLSYPDVLAVNPVSYSVARQNPDSVYTEYRSLGYATAMNPMIGFDRFGWPIYASESALMYGCSPFLLGPYDGLNLYSSQFGCSQFGYGFAGYGGYGYGYGGFPYLGGAFGGYYGGGYGYYGGLPVVVPKGGSAEPHGKVVNGKGYTQGVGGTGSTATPRSTDVSPSSSGSGSGSGSASSPPPPARTAVPRKP
jgi:hypothetical protein